MVDRGRCNAGGSQSPGEELIRRMELPSNGRKSVREAQSW